MKTLARILIVLALLVAGFLGYTYLTQPELGDVPPVPPPPAQTSAPADDATADEPVADDPVAEDPAADDPAMDVPDADSPAPDTPDADDQTGATSNILVIEVAGSTSGVIEIELLENLAPDHVAQIKQLAQDGAYDDVVFHRVIDGFMAQTGDVQFGKRGGDLGRAGTGSSDSADLAAEFSKLPFVKGVVGMARSSDPDSANSQFFIMFDSAPYLNGQYTIVGRVIAGQDVVDAIKKGDPNANGLVDAPDYMKSVRLKSQG